MRFYLEHQKYLETMVLERREQATAASTVARQLILSLLALNRRIRSVFVAQSTNGSVLDSMEMMVAMSDTTTPQQPEDWLQ
jgi:hypothetical protein